MVLHVIQHPLADKILTDLRDVGTGVSRFRELGKQLTYFLLVKATRTLKTKVKTVQTPLTSFDGSDIAQSVVIVPILRAGLSMLQPAMDLLQETAVGYIGLERDETTAIAGEYYCKLPDLKGKFVIIIDPMLATGHSAELALEKVLAHQPDEVVMVSMLASPEGVRHLENLFPEVPIFTAAVDERLDDNRYIFPGLGDFGDRAFGTN